MKIAIDISPIVYQTGVSTYTENLVKNLLETDSNNKYLLYGANLRMQRQLKKAVVGFKNNPTLKFYPIPPTLGEIIWNQLHIIPIETLIGKVDVFHSSDWYQPRTNAFAVTTVHDLAPILFPSLTDPKIVAAHTHRLELVKREADRVITPTNSGKKDLVEFGINQEKIRVIPEAADPIFKPQSNEKITKLKKEFNIEGPYILAIGVGGRKNTENIIKAVEQLKDFQLVVVGRKPDIFHAKYSSKIVFTGHIRKQLLPTFYSGALALAYPSSYEGFGLPLLEAFACGCPVVTSNISILSEVAGGAAVLVDHNQPADIANGIRKVVGDTKLWRKRGFDRLKQFSWKKTSMETLEVYQEYD